MSRNNNTVLSTIEINLMPDFYGSAVKINGHDVRYIRDISVSANLDSVPTVTIEVLGRIDAKIHGNVHVLETVYVDCETGEEMKSTREVRGG